MEWKIGAAYVRVSTESQEEYSPASQLKLIQDYAKREGYIIPAEYVYQDDGISGKRADKRPAFMLMIATAKEKDRPFDTIFVWKYSRFARNQEESLVYKNLLKRNGVTVRSISEPSADDSPFSGLIESIISWMDEYYVINLANEVRRGMTEKARRGEAMGTAPYGYTVKDKSFVPNENAEIVRYIFEQYANGKPEVTLARELGEKGVRTRRGNLPDNRWIHYILRNPAYIGKIRWSTDGHANYARYDYDDANVLIVDGKHPPIIDMELWDTVQARVNDRARAVKYVRHGTEIYMLRGIIRCGDCGSALTMVSTPSTALQCHKYARGQCKVSHSITVRKAEAVVIQHLEDCINRRAFTFAPRQTKSKGVSQDFQKLIAAEEKRLARAREAYLDGAFTASEYKDTREEIEANIARLNQAQWETKEELPDPESYQKRVLSVLEIIKSPDITGEEKNAALRTIIDRVVYHKKSNTFDLYFLA